MALTLDTIGYTYAAGTSLEMQALAGVSLSVAPGELVLVLGSTGSGKSTLLRLCAGLLEPATGSARLDDAPLTRSSARGAVGLVFQDPESQLFAETLAADVAFGPRNLGATAEEAAARVREALLSVGLDPDSYGGRSPFALSGGEARRAAIAGVLAMRPRYLLLDEPTAGLDARGRAAVREVVRGMRASAGVVVVSHSAEEFLGEADRVLVLAQGAPVYTGDARGLVADPARFEAAGLIAPDVLRFQMIARAQGHDCGPSRSIPSSQPPTRSRPGGGADGRPGSVRAVRSRRLTGSPPRPARQARARGGVHGLALQHPGLDGIRDRGRAVAAAVVASRVPLRIALRGLRAMGLLFAFTLVANALRWQPTTRSCRSAPSVWTAPGSRRGCSSSSESRCWSSGRRC